MKIDYRHYLKRKRSDLQTLVKNQKIKSYDDLKKFFLNISVSPPEEKDTYSIFIDQNKINKKLEPKAKETTSRTRRKRRTKKENVSIRADSKKQKNT